MNYDHSTVEKKWQKYWDKNKVSAAPDVVDGGKNKMILVEFPYPSGNLHMGHWYAFALPDMYARYQRMRGYNVMYPMGFDAFGLPAENAAIKRDIHPETWTRQNIEHMTDQLSSMGAMFDWSRMVSTIDPEYYRWTQWMFLRMFENDLAYRAKTTVNWCPNDKTVLANEQVVDGCCERCGFAVEQRDLEQWMLKITAYADRLIDDIEGLDWPHTTQAAQQNWIGRSQGATIRWELNTQGYVETFTTRPDTIFGATFLVISPEKAKEWMDAGWNAPSSVRQYVSSALSKRELERQENKEKSGVDTAVKASHPLTDEEIPVWVADYVLGSYGTGAIMAVPALDERDAEFAKKFDLPIKDIVPENMADIIEKLHTMGVGEAKTTYKLRDWVLSRQRYWGVPIPVIHCPSCGYVPVPDKDLPVKLPELKDFKPADDGRSPLAKATDWLTTRCPKCDGPAERETDTMDTFVDSSWYYIRYTDPKNKKAFADKEKMDAWLPVSIYVGGSEHNTMHLLYSRFFAKALYDLGYISFNEPFLARRNHGFVLAPDGQKMSKSRGNVLDPDKEVAQYGADVVRMYLAFLGPYDQDVAWDSKGIAGVDRFLKRVWTLFQKEIDVETNSKVERALHAASKKVSHDIDGLALNTCVSEYMKLLNLIESEEVGLTSEQRMRLVRVLAPFAPHFAEELWQEVIGQKASVHLESWPEHDEALLVQDSIEIPVQVNGKVRGTIVIAPDTAEDQAVFAARSVENIEKNIEGRDIKKVIYVPGKMLNIVVG